MISLRPYQSAGIASIREAFGPLRKRVPQKLARSRDVWYISPLWLMHLIFSATNSAVCSWSNADQTRKRVGRSGFVAVIVEILSCAQRPNFAYFKSVEFPKAADAGSWKYAPQMAGGEQLTDLQKVHQDVSTMSGVKCCVGVKIKIARIIPRTEGAASVSAKRGWMFQHLLHGRGIVDTNQD